jgi:outer membrane protein
MGFKNYAGTGLICLLFGIFSSTGLLAAEAKAVKIGVMNVQKVLVQSDAGQKAKTIFEEKGKELDKKYSAEKTAVYALEDEIKKKSTVWTKEIKDQKLLEYNMKGRELQAKVDQEMKALQDIQLSPILKALETIVEDYGTKNGFSVILDSKNGVIFYDKALDISDSLIAELNKVVK